MHVLYLRGTRDASATECGATRVRLRRVCRLTQNGTDIEEGSNLDECVVIIAASRVAT